MAAEPWLFEAARTQVAASGHHPHALTAQLMCHCLTAAAAGSRNGIRINGSSQAVPNGLTALNRGLRKKEVESVTQSAVSNRHCLNGCFNDR